MLAILSRSQCVKPLYVFWGGEGVDVNFKWHFCWSDDITEMAKEMPWKLLPTEKLTCYLTNCFEGTYEIQFIEFLGCMNRRKLSSRKRRVFNIMSLMPWRCKEPGHQQAWYWPSLQGIYKGKYIPSLANHAATSRNSLEQLLVLFKCGASQYQPECTLTGLGSFCYQM